MFRWLSRLWSRDQRRSIFGYHDGVGPRRADPLVVGRKLEGACPDYAEKLRLVAHDPPMELPGELGADFRRQKDTATAALIAATRTAFSVEPLSESGGLTEAETVMLLVRFLTFMGELAELARPFVTSQPRDAPSTPPDSPTPCSVDSGSAAEWSETPTVSS